jgi:flagellar biosynthesis protein FlhA
VDELIPAVMKIGQVQQVLQLLLREQVSIRPLAAILETLGDYAGRTQDPVLLVEQVRRRLARTICAAHRDNQHRLHVVTLQAELEDRIESAIEHTPDGWLVHLSPNSCESICHRIAAQTERLTKAGHRPVVLVHPRIRPAVRQLTSNDLPRLVVLSYDEVSPDTTIEAIGVVDDVD